ncbi:hypothetical protein [Haloferula sp. BvORR071]|uniref:hypothetical protein n=1 Tax=Haloferula sp. BvORR071 TaxID=1396141 RepID=UPI00054ED973|nr:hypothetical protein [Haloferula sp. BvORR071]
MKPSAILAPIATLFLGIAIGWLAKPDPIAVTGPNIPSPAKTTAASTPAPGSEQTRPAKTERPHSITEADNTAGDDSAGETDPAAEAEGRKMADQMKKAAIDRFGKKLEQFIADLDTTLTLTPEQKAQLQSALEAQLAELTGMMNHEGDPEQVLDKLPELGTPALEAALAASLTPEQKAALETYKAKDRARQADTKALKKLALLQGIVEFKDGQRDKAYRILSESAADSLAKPGNSTNFGELFTAGSGIDMDPYDLGLQQLMMDSAQELQGAHTDGGDNKDMMSAFRQKVDQLIEDRVNELKPVLDPAQLDKYREELRTKGLGPYAGLLTRDQPGQ